MNVAMCLLTLMTVAQEEGIQTYRDAKYKYTITYSGTMHFLSKKGKDGWFLKIYKEGEGTGFNPNLNLTVESIPEGAKVNTSKEYALGAIETLKKDVFKDNTMKAAIDPMEVKVGGKDFCKFVYGAEYQGMVLFVVQYCYYDAKERRALVWTVIDLAKNGLAHVAELERVILSVKFQ